MTEQLEAEPVAAGPRLVAGRRGGGAISGQRSLAARTRSSPSSRKAANRHRSSAVDQSFPARGHQTRSGRPARAADVGPRWTAKPRACGSSRHAGPGHSQRLQGLPAQRLRQPCPRSRPTSAPSRPKPEFESANRRPDGCGDGPRMSPRPGRRSRGPLPPRAGGLRRQPGRVRQQLGDGRAGGRALVRYFPSGSARSRRPSSAAA